MNDSLLTELRLAIETRRRTEELIADLRRDVIALDLPRPWVFSHARISGWVTNQPARSGFVTVKATRAKVETKLREAVRALPFENADGPHDVMASAWCAETGESIEVPVHIAQAVPACLRPEGHEWLTLLSDERPSEGYRQITEGCPHCDGQKVTQWPQPRGSEAAVTYDAPHYYPEGSVRRRLASAGQ